MEFWHAPPPPIASIFMSLYRENYACTLYPYSPVGINFICRIPEQYPDEAPDVDVEVAKGLTPKQCEELVLLARTQVLWKWCVCHITVAFLGTWLHNGRPIEICLRFAHDQLWIMTKYVCRMLSHGGGSIFCSFSWHLGDFCPLLSLGFSEKLKMANNPLVS